MTKQEKTAFLAHAGLQYIISLKKEQVPKLIHEILTDIAFINNGNPTFAEFAAIGAKPENVIKAIAQDIKKIKEAYNVKTFIEKN